jgi:hypothetical protein
MEPGPEMLLPMPLPTYVSTVAFEAGGRMVSLLPLLLLPLLFGELLLVQAPSNKLQTARNIKNLPMMRSFSCPECVSRTKIGWGFAVRRKDRPKQCRNRQTDTPGWALIDPAR